MFTFVYIHMYICMYAYICIYMQIQTHTYVCICMYIHTHTLTHTYVYVCICMFVCVYNGDNFIMKYELRRPVLFFFIPQQLLFFPLSDSIFMSVSLLIWRHIKGKKALENCYSIFQLFSESDKIQKLCWKWKLSW